MSGIDRIRKPGFQAFPIKRRSADPLQPESGEAEFQQAVDEFSEERVAQVQGAEEVLQNSIQDREKSHEKRQQGQQPKEEEPSYETGESDDSLIDLVI